MLPKRDLSRICPFKLSETYHALYDKQQQLGIDDDYLLCTSRGLQEDQEKRGCLELLLEYYIGARDNLITWYLKQSLVELNVTISLLTARIKFVEYKLGICDGLDLHQACSLSLVNFCSILADLTVYNVEPAERKTMHKISAEANVPVWLSHYRNQICHMPSESPCISILVPLVVKSLDYMRESFWSKVLNCDSFDEAKFKKTMMYVSALTHVTSMNKQLRLRKDNALSKKCQKVAKENMSKYTRACMKLRNLISQSPEHGLDVIARYIITIDAKDKSRNIPLLLEQIIYAQCFERFIKKIVSLVEHNPNDKKSLVWLQMFINLISFRTDEKVRINLREFELSASRQIIRLTDIAPTKCCQIAYKLMRLDCPVAKKLVIRMRHKLLPVLGRQKTLLLVKMSRITGFVE